MRAKNYWEKKMSTESRKLFGNDLGTFSSVMIKADPTVEHLGDVGKHVMFLVKNAGELVALTDEDLNSLSMSLSNHENYNKSSAFRVRFPKEPQTITELMKRIQEWSVISRKSAEQLAAEAGSKVVFLSDEWVVRRIMSPEASIFYGKGSGTGNGDAWCITTSSGLRHLESYTDHGKNPVYFIINKVIKDKMFAIIPTEKNFSVEPRCQNKMNRFVGTKGVEAEVPRELFDILLDDIFSWYEEKRGQELVKWNVFLDSSSAVVKPHDYESSIVVDRLSEKFLSLIDQKKMELTGSCDGMEFIPFVLKKCKNEKIMGGIVARLGTTISDGLMENSGETILHYIIRSTGWTKEIVKIFKDLLDNKIADPNRVNKNGQEALAFGIILSAPDEVLVHLIQAGGMISPKNYNTMINFHKRRANKLFTMAGCIEKISTQEYIHPFVAAEITPSKEVMNQLDQKISDLCLGSIGKKLCWDAVKTANGSCTVTFDGDGMDDEI